MISSVVSTTTCYSNRRDRLSCSAMPAAHKGIAVQSTHLDRHTFVLPRRDMHREAARRPMDDGTSLAFLVVCRFSRSVSRLDGTLFRHNERETQEKVGFSLG